MKVLALDIGSSAVRCAVVGGNEMSSLQSRTAINSAHDLLAFVTANLHLGVDGIAYAVAGDVHDGKIAISSNRPFLNGVDLRSITTTRTNMPTVVCNDMEAVGTGMAVLFPGLIHFTGITWSGGFNLQNVINGKAVGKSEAGHMQLDSSPYAPHCKCGKRGCTEAVIGGVYLQEAVRQATYDTGDPIPAEYKCPNLFLDERYLKGEPWAVKISNGLVCNIARVLANIMSVYRFSNVVWKGGVAKGVLCTQKREADVLELMREMVMNPLWIDELKFFYSWTVNPVKDADALLGAARIFIQQNCA